MIDQLDILLLIFGEKTTISLIQDLKSHTQIYPVLALENMLSISNKVTINIKQLSNGFVYE